jgi:tetratricopeptide (TPR) repeat protein
MSASSASVPPRPLSASSASVPPGAASPSAKPSSLPRVPVARSAPPAPPPMPQRSRTPVPPPVEPPRARRTEPKSDPPPLSPPPYSPRRRSLRSELEEDSYASTPVPRRRSALGFIVVSVLVAGGLLLAVVLGQKYYGVALPQAVPEAKTIDPRVAGFLASGEKALADGQLELAKESFDKASALAEKDPHVLLGLARLASIRADVPWLRTRLLAADATDDARATKETLTELSAVARRTAEDAVVVSPADPAALRAKIDALRISGEREAARSLAPKIASTASQAESAYVLAALDLAEPEPQWPSIIERLRMAAAVESGPGRARAALAYALARSGDSAGAQAEVDRLAAMPKAHPLLPLLRGLVERSRIRDAGADAAVTAVLDAGKGAARPGAPGGGGDARDLVVQGERARAKGDFDRARSLFSQALERNPNDSEALAGLGAVAYAQRDLAGARASYKRVLAINPNYMPALIGLADVEWDSGDKAAAIKMYKDIVDKYPPGTYPGRVQQRSEGG